MNPHSPNTGKTQRLTRRYFATSNTKLAASLLTIGVPFVQEAEDGKVPPLTNIYSDDRPFVPGKPGKVTYRLSENHPDGIKCTALESKFKGKSMPEYEEFGRILSELERSNPALVGKLRKLLPYVLLYCARTALENRERLFDMIKRATPMVLVRRGANAFTILSRNASDSIKKHVGL